MRPLRPLLRFRAQTLKGKFVFISVIAVVCLVVVQAGYLLYLHSETNRVVRNLTNEISSQIEISAGRIFDNVQQTGMKVIYSEASQAYLLSRSDYEIYATIQDLRRQVEPVIETNSYIQGFVYYRADRKYGYRYSDAGIVPLLISLSDTFQNENFTDSFRYFPDQEDPELFCLAYVQSVYCTTYARKGEFIGTGLVLLNSDILEEIFDDNINSFVPDLYLLDSDQRIICMNNQTQDKAEINIPAILKKSTTIIQEIGSTGLRVVCDIDQSRMLDNYRTSIPFVVLILVITILLFVALIQLYMRNIMRPIQLLHNEVAAVGDGGLKARIQMEGLDEISEIARAFNKLLDHQHALSRRMLETQQDLYETELDKTRNEILALETQVNPHFLLNSMQCICGMAAGCDMPQIADIAGHIASIFQYCIRRQEMVTIRDEVENARLYLSIVDIRFAHLFHWSIDVEESLLDCPIMKMTLQPLVENAVYHGLERQGGGSVWLRIQPRGDCIVIVVEDDGFGMEQSKLEELQAMLESPQLLELEVRRRKRIGIVNVCRRIKLIYGQAYGLRLAARGGGGFRITCTIPNAT